MELRWVVRPGAYFDSVTLMQVSARASAVPGVVNAAAVMATPANRGTLAVAGLWAEPMATAGPSDLLVVAAGETGPAAEAGLQAACALLEAPRAAGPAGPGSGRQADVGPGPGSGGQAGVGPGPGSGGQAGVGPGPGSGRQAGVGPTPPPRTVEQAAARLESPTLAFISVPGEYAAHEAGQCLRLGLHVHLFSDNVTVADEVALKAFAAQRGLLLMGPDCGTAIIGGVPLGFANAVRRGDIGVVGASGTGTQAVTTLIHRLGGGISHAIGTGGRDLTDAVGGVMCLAGLDALEGDPATRVVVLVSKPPGEATAARVAERLRQMSKPVVVCLLRAGPGLTETAPDLATAAARAVSLATGRPVAPPAPDAATEAAIRAAAPAQGYLRGIYTGGTLGDEAMLILQRHGIPVWSNVPLEPPLRLASGADSLEHTIVDLGEDEFTRGRPHPMIDTTLRSQRLVRELADPSVGVVLFDVVLGTGCHPDPAGVAAAAVQQGLAARGGGKPVAVLASVCGTEGDPQSLAAQEQALRQVGVLLFPSNAAAATAAARLLAEGRSTHA